MLDKTSQEENINYSLIQRIGRYFFGLSKRASNIKELLKRPNSAGAEIINICNANCSFCGYGKGDDGKLADPRVKSKLDIKPFKHLLKIYSEGGGGSFALSPILGEASAHPNWLDLVKEARSHKNITGVTCYTNATLLHRHGFKEILQSGLTTITISTALGDKKQYKRLYGLDMYDQVVDNILNILKTNNKIKNPINVYMALRIDKPYNKFYKSKLYNEITKYVSPRKISILEEWDDFRGIIKKDGLPLGHSFKVNQYEEEKKNIPCYALYRKLQVLIDGTIQGCSCRVEPELWGNNIKKYSNLKDAWRDEKIEKIRNDWFKGKLKKCCRECSHYLPYTKLFSENYLIQNIKEYILSKIKKNKVIVKQGKKSKNQM